MIRFLIRRIIGGALVLLAISLITFWLFFAVPNLLHSNPAVLYAGRSPSPATVHAVSVKLGLDQPFWTQYWDFLKGIFVGRTYGHGLAADHCSAPCLGFSFINNEPVWSTIISDLPVDISLAAGAAVLWLISGVSIGITSALRRGSIFDRAAMTVALGGVSLPIYFTGTVALSIFVYGNSNLHWFTNQPYIGVRHPIQWAHNLILPWICLAFLYSALYARLTRATMLETMSEDFIRTARAKGLPERRVIFKHGLRAAITPIVTIFGLDVGLLLGSAVLTEQTFGLVGIGKQAIISIGYRDMPVVLGITLFAAFFVVVANIIVDVLYAYVDPRVTYS
jgi:peptide/nickel transport system permease protein